MPPDIAILKGTIHGKTIALERESGLPDGQLVSVMLQPTLPAGDHLRRSFGSWAEDSEELDRFLDRIRHDRKLPRGDRAA